MRWILGQENPEALIVWLFGPAGSGKSAITQTLAELWCYEPGILLASFFSWSDPSRNHFRPLFATIAYQVVVNFPDSRDIRARVSEQDPLVLTQSFETQLNSFIIGPLQQLYLAGRPASSSDPYLILIDGLDECADLDLRAISRAVKRCQFPLKILFASRPELHLITEFNSRTPSSVTLRWMINSFPKMTFGGSWRTNMTTSGEPTLSSTSFFADIIKQLVGRSSGQFIHLSTVVKFITSTRRRPDDSLNVILEPRFSSSEHNSLFSELDALYQRCIRISFLLSPASTKPWQSSGFL